MKFMAHFDKATLASIVQVIDGDEHFAQVEVFGLGLWIGLLYLSLEVISFEHFFFQFFL